MKILLFLRHATNKILARIWNNVHEEKPEPIDSTEWICLN